MSQKERRCDECKGTGTGGGTACRACKGRGVVLRPPPPKGRGR